MELLVSLLAINGEDNVDIELMAPDGSELPAFSPGSHLDVRTPRGVMRQYSLCGSPEDRLHYRLCVRRDSASQGGSVSLHEDLRLRGLLEVSAPRNLFALPSAERYLLFSAGIGITPIISMARALLASGKLFEWHHYEHSRLRTAFLEELTEGPLQGFCRLHITGQEGRFAAPRVPPCLAKSQANTAVMACGPNGFLDSLESTMLANGWAAEQLHLERFKAKAPSPGSGEAGSFQVQIASSGRYLTVGPDERISDVLLNNGIEVHLSCEQGMCGACLTHVLAGTPDHRDSVLSAAEKETGDQIAICCSRSKSPVLILDL